MAKARFPGTTEQKALWISCALLLVFVAQVGVVFYAFEREADATGMIVARNLDMHASANQFDDDLSALNRTLIGSAGGIYAPPGVGHYLLPYGQQLKSSWARVDGFFAEELDPADRSEARSAIDGLSAFLERARQEHALSTPDPSPARREVLHAVYEEWLDYFAPLNRYTKSIRKLVPIQSARDTDAIAELRQGLFLVIVASGVTGLTLIASVVFLLNRSIFRPVLGITEATLQISDGDLDYPVPEQTRQDEIGDVARAIAEFRNKMVENASLQAEADSAMRREAQERHMREVEAGRLEHETQLRALHEERNTELQKEVEDRIRKEEELRRAMKIVETASLAKSDFLSNMSHELRTPLNAIIGFTDFLQLEADKTSLTQRHRGYLADISESAHHLLDLINDLLDLSRIEQGELLSDPEVLQVAPLIDACVRMVADSANKKQITLGTEVQPDIPSIHCDPRHLKQIVLNLLSNAIKYTPSGGSVELRCVALNDGVQISVTDTGIGIAEGEIENVMLPFRRAENAAHIADDSIGLGLALSKAYSRENGGDLHLESQLGKGTVATVTLVAA